MAAKRAVPVPEVLPVITLFEQVNPVNVAADRTYLGLIIGIQQFV